MNRHESEDIEVTYDPRRCIHAAECVRGLRSVFDPNRKPWIDPSAAPAGAIAEVISRCPTGALHFQRRDGGPNEAPSPNTIVPAENGPLYLRGQVVVENNDGAAIGRDTRMALCRCGASRHKPYCDGMHEKVGFEAPGCANPQAPDPHVAAADDSDLTIHVVPNGPLLVSGAYEFRPHEEASETREGGAFCRCGASSNKPFCDGTHKKIDFVAE
ncbi:MAG: CDGSH iron-sulfur domain-containing protein [bacterium]